MTATWRLVSPPLGYLLYSTSPISSSSRSCSSKRTYMVVSFCMYLKRSYLSTMTPLSQQLRRPLRPTYTHVRHRNPLVYRALKSQSTSALSAPLKDLDTYLNGNESDSEKQAVAIVARLKEEGTLKAFGAAQQVPKRIYTLEELRLNQIEASKLLAPKDNTLNSVRNVAQVMSWE